MGNYRTICRSSHKHFIAKKQSEIELMRKIVRGRTNFMEDGDRAVRARRGVLEMLESVMKLNGLT